MTTRRRHRGFTLVELMVAMVLGLLVIGAVGAIFLSGSRNYREDERITRMHDNTRFALTELTHDLEMAGHWSDMFAAPENIDAGTLPPTDLDSGDCGPAGTRWKFDTVPAVEVVNNVTASTATEAFSCITGADVVEGTDIIAVKGVAGTVSAKNGIGFSAADDGRIFLKTNNVSGVLYQRDKDEDDVLVTPDTSGVLGDTYDWEYRVSIYYIRQYFRPNDGVPSLCKKILVNEKLQDDPAGCIPGIENLQYEVGLDLPTSNDGIADRYRPPLAAIDPDQIVSIRIAMLSRSVEPLNGYVNTKTYKLGDDSTAAVVDPNPDDAFPRELNTAVVALRNPSTTRRFLR